jgi:hypothetical protein
MPEILRPLQRLGVARGVLGGSRGWVAVAAAAAGLRLTRKLFRRDPVVERFRLDPGQTLEIRHFPKLKR